MELSFSSRCRKILEACLDSSSGDPVEIFNFIAGGALVRIHGPEHHVLDGAALLTAFFNAGGEIDLEAALCELMERGMEMPGAICGHWGVCGAVASMGAALAIIDGTGPISDDGSWGEHMKFTSEALMSLAAVGGPRCCKRDAYLSFAAAVDYINARYPVELPKTTPTCVFYPNNHQCIGARCPYHPDC